MMDPTVEIQVLEVSEYTLCARDEVPRHVHNAEPRDSGGACEELSRRRALGRHAEGSTLQPLEIFPSL